MNQKKARTSGGAVRGVRHKRRGMKKQAGGARAGQSVVTSGPGSSGARAGDGLR